MAVVSGSTTSSSGLINYSARFQWRIQRPVSQRMIWVLKSPIRFCGSKHFVSRIGVSASSGGYHDQIRTGGGELFEEPLWIIMYKEAYWSLKFVFGFLMEQPGQLKCIEWPAFQSMLKTATLTLALVALLIVALASIDSALSFLLALILRRRS